MKRALVPLLMISHLAHAETENLQQDSKESSCAMNETSDCSADAVKLEGNGQYESPTLTLQDEAKAVEDPLLQPLVTQDVESAAVAVDLRQEAIGEPKEEKVADQSLAEKKSSMEETDEALMQQLLVLQGILQELKQESVGLENKLENSCITEIGAIALQQSEQQETMERSPRKTSHSTANKHEDFFATGAFLWWCAHEDGLAYASTGFNSNPTSGNAPAQTSVPRGSIKKFGGEYHPGFKAGLGYLFSSHWDVYLNWTRLRQHPSHDVDASSKDGSPLYDEWGNQAVVTGHTIVSAIADWKLNYNTLDFEVGRKFMPTKRISLRTHVGVRGVLILQNYNVTEVVDIPTPSAGRIVNPSVYVRNFNNFRGIALRAGLNSGYHFFPEWEVFGGFAASLISGKFKVLNYQTTNDNTFPHPYMNVVDRFWSVKPELEAALGVRWGRDFADRCHIQFDVSWEELWLPGQNQMRRYLTPTVDNASTLTIDMPQSINEKGDLGIYGLTFGARLDF